MKWGLKRGISIDADSGPPWYVLWCCGGISHQLLTFFRLAVAILCQSTLKSSKILTVLRQGLGKKFRLWRQAGCLLRWDILPLTQSYLEKSQVFLLHCFPLHRSRHTYNLFITSKNEATNSPIHEFKVLHKDQRGFQTPFLTVYYFLCITLKNIFHFKGLTFCSNLNSWIGEFVVSVFDVTNRLNCKKTS